MTNEAESQRTKARLSVELVDAYQNHLDCKKVTSLDFQGIGESVFVGTTLAFQNSNVAISFNMKEY